MGYSVETLTTADAVNDERMDETSIGLVLAPTEDDVVCSHKDLPALRCNFFLP